MKTKHELELNQAINALYRGFDVKRVKVRKEPKEKPIDLLIKQNLKGETNE